MYCRRSLLLAASGRGGPRPIGSLVVFRGGETAALSASSHQKSSLREVRDRRSLQPKPSKLFVVKLRGFGQKHGRDDVAAFLDDQAAQSHCSNGADLPMEEEEHRQQVDNKSPGEPSPEPKLADPERAPVAEILTLDYCPKRREAMLGVRSERIAVELAQKLRFRTYKESRWIETYVCGQLAGADVV